MDAGLQQKFQIRNNEVDAKLQIEQNSKPRAQLMLIFISIILKVESLPFWIFRIWDLLGIWALKLRGCARSPSRNTKDCKCALHDDKI